MCHVQLIDYQQWLLALRLDGTLLGTRAVRVSAIEDRPLGKTKDDIDAAFITADLIGRPKATYSYVEVAAVAYPGIAEVETAAICTNNRYLQVTDLARLHALTLAYSNGAGILLVSSQNDGMVQLGVQRRPFQQRVRLGQQDRLRGHRTVLRRRAREDTPGGAAADAQEQGAEGLETESPHLDLRAAPEIVRRCRRGLGQVPRRRELLVWQPDL